MKRGGNAGPTSFTWTSRFGSVGVSFYGVAIYFDSATSPTVFWVPLDKVDLTAAAPVRRLALEGGETYSGDASAHLRPAEPCGFLEARPK